MISDLTRDDLIIIIGGLKAEREDRRFENVKLRAHIGRLRERVDLANLTNTWLLEDITKLKQALRGESVTTTPRLLTKPVHMTTAKRAGFLRMSLKDVRDQGASLGNTLATRGMLTVCYHHWARVMLHANPAATARERKAEYWKGQPEFTIADLVMLTKIDVLKTPGIGRKTLNAIIDLLAKMGLGLGRSEEWIQEAYDEADRDADAA